MEFFCFLKPPKNPTLSKKDKYILRRAERILKIHNLPSIVNMTHSEVRFWSRKSALGRRATNRDNWYLERASQILWRLGQDIFNGDD